MDADAGEAWHVEDFGHDALEAVAVGHADLVCAGRDGCLTVNLA